MSECPYPPSDPFCQQGPTTTTARIDGPATQHVVVDNNPSAGYTASVSDDAARAAVIHQEHTMILGFTAVCVVILLVGAMIAGAITGLKGSDDRSQD